MSIEKIIFSLALVGLFSSPAFGRETGTALKTTEIKIEPYRDAKPSGSLAKGDKVDILKRQGGWYQVKVGTSTGWVRMLSVRRGVVRKGAIETDRILGLASGRAGTGRVVATTGIRGLTEEDLKNAKYNEAEVNQMESFITSENELRKFAAEGKLVTRKVDDLPNSN